MTLTSVYPLSLILPSPLPYTSQVATLSPTFLLSALYMGMLCYQTRRHLLCTGHTDHKTQLYMHVWQPAATTAMETAAAYFPDLSACICM